MLDHLPHTLTSQHVRHNDELVHAFFTVFINIKEIACDVMNNSVICFWKMFQYVRLLLSNR